jgi:hypothetical protein
MNSPRQPYSYFSNLAGRGVPVFTDWLTNTDTIDLTMAPTTKLASPTITEEASGSL